VDPLKGVQKPRVGSRTTELGVFRSGEQWQLIEHNDVTQHYFYLSQAVKHIFVVGYVNIWSWRCIYYDRHSPYWNIHVRWLRSVIYYVYVLLRLTSQCLWIIIYCSLFNNTHCQAYTVVTYCPRMRETHLVRCSVTSAGWIMGLTN